MPPTISWILVLKIKPDKAEEFTAIMNRLIALATEEADTLCYEWNFTPDGETCHIYESYTDSDAVLTHAGNNGELVGQLLTLVTPVSFVIYGSPSEEVRHALEDLNPVYLETRAGFRR